MDMISFFFSSFALCNPSEIIQDFYRSSYNLYITLYCVQVFEIDQGNEFV
jgi:hypothetical protein